MQQQCTGHAGQGIPHDLMSLFMRATVMLSAKRFFSACTQELSCIVIPASVCSCRAYDTCSLAFTKPWPWAYFTKCLAEILSISANLLYTVIIKRYFCKSALCIVVIEKRHVARALCVTASRCDFCDVNAGIGWCAHPAPREQRLVVPRWVYPLEQQRDIVCGNLGFLLCEFTEFSGDALVALEGSVAAARTIGHTRLVILVQARSPVWHTEGADSVF